MSSMRSRLILLAHALVPIAVLVIRGQKWL
jgi:hypothetical protein